MIAINTGCDHDFVPLFALQAVAFLFRTLYEGFDPCVCVMVNPQNINLPYIIPSACFFKYAGNLDHYYDHLKG